MPPQLAAAQGRVRKPKINKTTGLPETKKDKEERLHALAVKRNAFLTAHSENVKAQRVDRVKYFQERLPEQPMNADSMVLLIHEYLARHEDEMEDLEAARKPGRQMSKKQRELEKLVCKENDQFDDLGRNGGLWIPDLRDEDTLAKLKLWQGHHAGLDIIKGIKVNMFGQVRELSQPGDTSEGSVSTVDPAKLSL